MKVLLITQEDSGLDLSNCLQSIPATVCKDLQLAMEVDLIVIEKSEIHRLPGETNLKSKTIVWVNDVRNPEKYSEYASLLADGYKSVCSDLAYLATFVEKERPRMHLRAPL